jgi:pimeloyl-ACP methyl ester carboxylesterase
MPGMDTHYLQVWREQARERGIPEPDIDQWLGLARPLLWLHRVQDDPAAANAPVVWCRGGHPSLPLDVEWPAGPDFVASVDCAAVAITLLSSDAPAGVPAEAFTVTRGRFGAIPHTYVACTKDNTIPIALQRRFITEIDAISQTPTAVIDLGTSHSPFLSQPAALAAAIAQACR